jgi:hypothetical protein
VIKLTVLYNLPPGANHEEFVEWRTTTHQKENMSMPGLIKSDFYAVKGTWGREDLPYRYVTEAYFPDMDTFEQAFFDRDYQAQMVEWLDLMAEPMFLISEEVLSESADSAS